MHGLQPMGHEPVARIYADGWRRSYLAHLGGAPDAFCRAQMVRSITMSRHLVQIAEEVLLIVALGIVGSGLFSTANTNSWIRGFVRSCAFYETQCAQVAAMRPGDSTAIRPAPVPWRSRSTPSWCRPRMGRCTARSRTTTWCVLSW